MYNPEYARAYYLKNKAKILARISTYGNRYKRDYARAYYLRNREKILAQSSVWAKANPEKRRAIGRRASKKHQYHKTSDKCRTFKRWQAMMARCYNPKHLNFHRYGGRGIVVCDQWHDHKVFVSDMGICPPGMTLDRIDNSQGYQPGNCRWATMKQQQNNRSNNRFVTCNGAVMAVSLAADCLGVKRNGLLSWTRRHPDYCGDVNRLQLVQSGNRSFYRLKL